MSYPMTAREAIAQETMSDDALADERKAQDMVNMAKRILIEAKRHTSIMDAQIADGLDALPNLDDWNERIMEERQHG